MAKDPAFLFYPNDYIGGTMGMTLEEKGAYVEVLMMQFNRGHMTSHMIRHTIGQLWDTVQVKFIQDDKGLWYNKRLEDEQIKRRKFVNSRKNNILGKNQYSNSGAHTTSHMSGHMTSHMENENENENKDKNRNEKLNGRIPYEIIIDDLNRKAEKAYKPTSRATKELIHARFEEGFTVEDFCKVHSNMTVKWKNDPERDQYLRPATLYRASKFEGYLNAKVFLSDKKIISAAGERTMTMLKQWAEERKAKDAQSA